MRDDAARTEDPRVFELQDGKAVSLCQTEYHETMTHTFYLPQSPDVEYGPVWIDASHHGPTEVCVEVSNGCKLRAGGQSRVQELDQS